MSVIISYLLQKSIVVTMNENRRNNLGIIRREGIRFLSYLASTLVVSKCYKISYSAHDNYGLFGRLS